MPTQRQNKQEERKMKKALTIVGIILVSASVAAAQSTVKGVVVNKANV